MESRVEDITQILDAIRTGDQQAGVDLLPRVYGELRRMAGARMAAEEPGHSIQATVLVHDAWMQLGAGDGAHFENRVHFFGAAAQAMRRILVESAERRRAKKRGLDVEHIDISEVEIVAPVGTDDEVLAVHDALDRLTVVDARKAEVVKLRYFAGISFQESASLLGISEVTVKRDWAYARAWLHQDISASRSKNN